MSAVDAGNITVLIADDDSAALNTLQALLRNNGFNIIPAADGQEAWQLAQKENPSLILLDINMPRLSGYEVLKRLKNHAELKYIPVIFLTARAETEEIALGLDLGADDYITKPYRLDEVISRINAFVRLRRLYLELKEAHRETAKLVNELARPYRLDQIVAQSEAMKKIGETIAVVANSCCPVLISGESGVGKELVARALHYESPRREKPFIAKNCAAFQETLLEAELFGHVRGAFTGAVEDKVGLFREADGGTLFLDEVAEMSPLLQAKLLRVLQDGSFMPIGSTKEENVDVRVVAATNKNIKPLIESGQFREDLYYRINVVALEIPALRERREDVLVLASHFLRELCAKRRATEKRFNADAQNMLKAYSWPGNVRELKNAMERLMIFFADLDLIGLAQIERILPGLNPTATSTSKSDELTLQDHLAKVEREFIEQKLNALDWNKSQAAKQLGMSRGSLLNKISQYQLKPRYTK